MRDDIYYIYVFRISRIVHYIHIYKFKYICKFRDYVKYMIDLAFI